jgi:hypothetical protein
MGFGRIFRIKESMQLQVRVEFQNIFNRLFYSVPADGVGIFGLPSTTPETGASRSNTLGGQTGLLSSGYGFVNWVEGAGAQPRSGQLVARFTS